MIQEAAGRSIEGEISEALSDCPRAPHPRSMNPILDTADRPDCGDFLIRRIFRLFTQARPVPASYPCMQMIARLASRALAAALILTVAHLAGANEVAESSPHFRKAFIAVLEQPHRDFASFMAESERILVPSDATRQQIIGAAVKTAIEHRDARFMAATLAAVRFFAETETFSPHSASWFDSDEDVRAAVPLLEALTLLA